MKTRLILPIVAALVVGSLLISCSSDSGSDEDIEGVETGPGQSRDSDEQAENPEPTQDGTGRPEINLPSDMHNIFDDTEMADPTKNAIISDVVQGINAVDMAISESDPDLDAVEFYNVGDGLVNARSYIRGAAEANDTWTGTAEYYNFTVDVSAANPVVTYCSDVTDVQTKELDTGEVLPKSEDAQNFAYNQIVVMENDLGVWQVVEVFARNEDLDRSCER